MALRFFIAHCARRSARVLVFGIALLRLANSVSATEARYAQDIAIFDRALAAESRPGENWIRFGDVGITPERLRDFRVRLARGEPDFVTPGGTAFKWPGGNVYYRFNPAQVSDGTITAAKMQQFRDSVAEWAGWANLTFVESIAGQSNYITVREDSSLSGGFSSSVGMAGGEQFVDFGPSAWNRGTICHEVGHALGLWHEQQRTDRDTYVVINLSNIATGNQPNFAIIPGSTNHNAYDFLSVMHYERNALAINPNLDTISMQPAYTQFANLIGRVYYRTLSKLDRKGMAEVYGNPSPLPGAIVTNTKESGRGSLRNAIYYAFDRSTDLPAIPTTVVFNIPLADPGFAAGVFTIKPTFLMVAPGAGTTIDGSTQTTFTGDTNPSGPEIVLDGSQVAAQNLNLVAPGFVLIEASCTIKNLVINGFNQQGIAINGTLAAQNGSAATGNIIAGCYIGCDKTGTIAVGNGNTWPGVEIFGGASNNTIGGTTAAARNVISGNSGHGIVIQQSGSNGNVISGNYIGTNAAGSSALTNSFTGVAIFGGAQNNTIGGTSAGARNILSGNKRQGFIFADAGTNGNVALGNYVGLNATGTAALANGNENFATHSFYPGAAIFNGAQNNVIGGTAAGATNVISGNTGQGIIIADAGTNGNTVRGNLIGTDPAGTTALGNGFADPPNNYRYAGISIFGGAQANSILANVISGNAAQGMSISGTNTNANLVQGNFIGTNAAGAAALANAFEGIAVFGGAQSNTIGGNTPGAGNVIAGNLARGIGFFDAATTNNSVQGNFIGLNAAGTAALANAFSGVECYLASNNTIGGTSPGARNYISGNSDRGVVIDGSAATGNRVIGNTIGLSKNGGAVPNGTQGVALFTGAHGNFVGGSMAGESNLISANTQEGVALYDSTTLANTVSRNSIYANQSIGIGRYTGSNNNQPAPVLSSATLSTAGNPNGTDVAGSIAGAATVEFFASPPGGDEGQFFLGALSAAGGGFSASLPATVPAGYVLTATATASGSTSQFSSAISVTALDVDSDGLPDNWMLLHFGHANGQAADLSRPNDDADGDGMTNLEEFRAGTDPRLASSRLRILTVTKNGNDLSLSFTSIVGKTYRVEARNNFSLANWMLQQDQVAATATTTAVTDFGATLAPQRVYRISVEP